MARLTLVSCPTAVLVPACALRSTSVLRALVLATVISLPAVALAQPPPGAPAPVAAANPLQDSDPTDTPGRSEQLEQLWRALTRLPLATALAGVLALRPRRRGTPPRQAPVVETQIILAIVGAVVMLIVGQSLARAFGIVGAAGLVRYRAKIEDPKDAGVMLSTLAIGLASGVGLWMLATFATAFVLAVLWTIESFEPTVRQKFLLTVKAKDPAALTPRIKELLARHGIEFELRNTTPEELCYDVLLPIDQKTDRLSAGIQKLGAENVTAVEWEEKKTKK